MLDFTVVFTDSTTTFHDCNYEMISNGVLQVYDCDGNVLRMFSPTYWLEIKNIMML